MISIITIIIILLSSVSLAVWNNMFEEDRAKSSWGQGSAGIRWEIIKSSVIFIITIIMDTYMRSPHVWGHAGSAGIMWDDHHHHPHIGAQPPPPAPLTILVVHLPPRQQPPLKHQRFWNPQMKQPGLIEAYLIYDPNICTSLTKQAPCRHSPAPSRPPTGARRFAANSPLLWQFCIRSHPATHKETSHSLLLNVFFWIVLHPQIQQD